MVSPRILGMTALLVLTACASGNRPPPSAKTVPAEPPAAQAPAKPGAPEVSAQISAEAARNVDSVAALPPPWSQNPPERDEFNEVRDKVNEVLGGLKHPA